MADAWFTFNLGQGDLLKRLMLMLMVMGMIMMLVMMMMMMLVSQG